MALPTLEQYNEVAQNPASAFFDLTLQKGEVKRTGLGLPLAVCGGFALTYTITSGASKYAVRCFHKEARDRETRYAAISKKLSTLNSGYFVNFEFQKNGIKVKGQSYPIVKMAWAKGETLGEFVNSNFNKKDALLALKQSLEKLSLFLEKNHISHGDIQPGNVMVSDGGRTVQLIDYDGMYLPEINNLTSEEIGHRNFQHPDRANINPWNEYTDRFSFILLSIVLDALIINPQLWIKSKSDGDKFLIGANDFVSPASSPIFSELLALPAIKEKIDRFIAICCGNYDAIPSLTDYIKPTFSIQIPEKISTRKVGYISTYPVINANDYEQCLQHVGDVVELIGKVADVHFAYTKYHKPYYFLNFADWRGNAVKICVWSNFLEKNKFDFSKFKNKFISVIGLVQPPYHGQSKRINYNHLSIFLGTTINEIDEKEAQYRLNYVKTPLPTRKFSNEKTSTGTQNKPDKDIFNSKTNDRSSGKTVTSDTPKRSNKDIFDSIRNDGSSRKSSTIHTYNPQNGNIIHCQKCNNPINIGSSDRCTGICNRCHTKFVYSPKKEIHVRSNKDIFDSIRNDGSSRKSSTIHTFNPQNGNIIHCPKCNNPINVGDSGNFTGICNRCHTRFDYFQNAKSIKMKNENPSPNQPRWGENDKLSLNSSSNQSSQQTTQKKGSSKNIILVMVLICMLFFLLHSVK